MKDGTEQIAAKIYRCYDDMTEISIWNYGDFTQEIIDEFEFTDLIDELKRKINILMPYLPSQLSEEEIQKIVDECIAETGASSMKDMGKVMSVIMPKVNGRCDGHIINSLIKQRLS